MSSASNVQVQQAEAEQQGGEATTNRKRGTITDVHADMTQVTPVSSARKIKLTISYNYRRQAQMEGPIKEIRNDSHPGKSMSLII